MLKRHTFWDLLIGCRLSESKISTARREPGHHSLYDVRGVRHGEDGRTQPPPGRAAPMVFASHVLPTPLSPAKCRLRGRSQFSIFMLNGGRDGASDPLRSAILWKEQLRALQCKFFWECHRTTKLERKKGTKGTKDTTNSPK